MITRRYLLGDGLRFIAAGGANTLLTLLLFQLLLFFLPWAVSYSLAFAAGLAFVTWIYPLWVFAEGVQSPARAAANAVYYLVSYGTAVGLLALFTEQFGVHPRLSVLFVLALVTPVNFVFSRWVFHAKRSRGT